MTKNLLKALLPPVVADVGRRLIPGRPMFSGAHASPKGILDERPWLSDQRLAYAREELQEALDLSRRKSPLMGSLLIPCLMVNLLSSQGRACKVLDFGGGTGAAYYRIRNELTHRSAVTWLVTDNRRLIDLGLEYKSDEDRIFFSESIPADRDIDVVFINTALQYVTDCWALLSALVERGPKFFILTRLVAGDIPTFFTRQNKVHGGKTPCMFLNIKEVLAFLAESNFELVHSSGAAEDTWERSHYKDVPPSAQLKNTINLVFQSRPT